MESISVYSVISTIAPELYHSSKGCKVKLSTDVPKQVRLNSFIIPARKSPTLISGANVAKSTSPVNVCVLAVVEYVVCPKVTTSNAS